MKLNVKEVLRPALILTIICLIVTGALAGANELTKEPIAAQSAKAEQEARTEVLPGAAEFTEILDTSYEFAPYAGTDASGKQAGYVIVTKATGYGGTLKVMTGISAEGAVTGVSILSNNETVGLGANCVKESFRSQFVRGLPSGGFAVYKKGATPPDEGGIEALTGATITSNAVVKAVNEAVRIYGELTKEGAN